MFPYPRRVDGTEIPHGRILPFKGSNISVCLVNDSLLNQKTGTLKGPGFGPNIYSFDFKPPFKRFQARTILVPKKVMDVRDMRDLRDEED